MEWVAQAAENWDAEEPEAEEREEAEIDDWCSHVQDLEPSADEEVPSLLELCCRVAGRLLSFQLVQEGPALFDRDVLSRIAYWSFPCRYSDIRRYIELSSGSPRAAQELYQSTNPLTLISHIQIGGSRDCIDGLSDCMHHSSRPSYHSGFMSSMGMCTSNDIHEAVSVVFSLGVPSVRWTEVECFTAITDTCNALAVKCCVR